MSAIAKLLACSAILAGLAAPVMAQAPSSILDDILGAAGDKVTQPDLDAAPQQEQLQDLAKEIAIDATSKTPTVEGSAVSIEEIDQINRQAERLRAEAELKKAEKEVIQARLETLVILSETIKALDENAKSTESGPEGAEIDVSAEPVAPAPVAPSPAEIEMSALPRLVEIQGAGGAFRATVELPSGAYQTIKPGDRISGGFIVKSISATEVELTGPNTKHGYQITPTLPEPETEPTNGQGQVPQQAIDLGQMPFGVF